MRPKSAQHHSYVTTFARRPCPALAPWVQQLWATHGDLASLGALGRERVLPTGAMHVAIRLSDAPLSVFADAVGDASRTMGHVIVGGARAAAYVKQTGDGASSVGVQLRPGAARALLGVPASALAEQHTPLDALWGLDALYLRERLHDVMQRSLGTARRDSPDVGLRAQVDLLELVLLERARLVDSLQHGEWVVHVVRAIEADVPLAAIVEECGVSHRTLITRFRDMVGLPPKVFARVRRFQRVVDVLSKGQGGAALQRPTSLAQLALASGYADQAHMSREFFDLSGVSPSTYSKLAPVAANHVPVR